MIQRQYPSLITAYHGTVDELAYPTEDGIQKPLKWGVCLGFPEPISIDIEDMLEDDNLHLGMASYTKSRWTRFLRRYFRDDLEDWVAESMEKLNRYPSRPFVASYDVNHDTKHNYGGCLSSLQIRINPTPRVILYSRACHLDKVGFLDLSLMHVVAKAKGLPKVEGSWVITLCYISAISQPFYMKRFNKPDENHRLLRSLGRLNDVAYEDIKFGPLKRGRKRMMALDEFGEVQRSSFVRDLTLTPPVSKKQQREDRRNASAPDGDTE